MKQIHIRVRDKRAELVNPNDFLYCWNNDFEVVFDFDEAWQGYTAKTAIFVFGDNSIEKPFEGNICEGVIIKNSLECYIGVYSGDLITTTAACIRCVLTAKDMIANTSTPCPDKYNEIVKIFNDNIASLNKKNAEQDAEISDLQNRYNTLGIAIDDAEARSKAYTDERIAELHGDMFLYSEDDTPKHIKNIPSAVMPFAFVDKIGGKTEKVTDGGEKLVSAPVTSIISQGRNLTNDVEFYLSLGFVKQGSGYWKGSQTTGRLWTNNFNIANRICVSLDVRILTGISGNNSPLNIVFYYTDGTSGGYAIKDTEYKRVSFISANNKTVSRITWVYNVNGTFEVKDLMINVGTEPLPYEKYTLSERHIPTAITSLDGYGDSDNVMDFAEMNFHRNTKRIVYTGSENWECGYGNNDGFFYYLSLPSNFKAVKDITYFTQGGDEETYSGEYLILGNELWVCSEFETLEAWKAELSALNESGAPLTMLYELTESEIEDISAESDINPITVYGGGTVVFENAENKDVPNTISYIKRNREYE